MFARGVESDLSTRNWKEVIEMENETLQMLMNLKWWIVLFVMTLVITVWCEGGSPDPLEAQD